MTIQYEETDGASVVFNEAQDTDRNIVLVPV
jgi:hypothetical protein